MLAHVPAALAQRHPGAEVRTERERLEREQRIEADPPVDAEAALERQQLRPWPPSGRVRGDRQVPRERDARVAVVAQRRRCTRCSGGNPGRRPELRVETPDRQHEVRRVAPLDSRSAMSPLTVKPPTLESYRLASSENASWLKSSTPTTSKFSLTNALFQCRQPARTCPRMVSRIGSGSSRMMPELGLQHRRLAPPQPMIAIGPNVKRPSAGGKNAPQVVRIASAFFSGSSGNSTWSRVWRPHRVLQRRRSTVRLIPSRPPTPLRVNPSPSGSA